jgi:hypothetical protein
MKKIIKLIRIQTDFLGLKYSKEKCLAGGSFWIGIFSIACMVAAAGSYIAGI